MILKEIPDGQFEQQTKLLEYMREKDLTKKHGFFKRLLGKKDD
jgi:hypothetical protein